MNSRLQRFMVQSHSKREDVILNDAASEEPLMVKSACLADVKALGSRNKGVARN